MSSLIREGETSGPGGTRLFWRLRAPKATQANLFVIHGLGEHSGRYEGLARWMNERGVSVFSFDLRGHGRSQGPRGDLDRFQDFSRDLLSLEGRFAQLLEEAGLPSEPRFLFGHSLGGLIALRRLQAPPDGSQGYSGAIVSAPWLGTPAPPWLRSLGRFLGRRAPGLSIPTGLSAAKLTRDPSKAREWKDDPLIHTRLTGRLFLEVERVQRLCLGEGGRLMGVPLLYLVPERDPVVDSEVTLAFVRGIDDDGHRVEILRGRRHEALNDLGREEVLEMLSGWILGEHRDQGQKPEMKSPSG